MVVKSSGEGAIVRFALPANHDQRGPSNQQPDHGQVHPAATHGYFVRSVCGSSTWAVDRPFPTRFPGSGSALGGVGVGGRPFKFQPPGIASICLEYQASGSGNARTGGINILLTAGPMSVDGKSVPVLEVQWTGATGGVVARCLLVAGPLPWQASTRDE